MKIVIIAGGTFVDIRPHFSLSAPAFGTVGVDLHNCLQKICGEENVEICNVFTEMAGSKYAEVSERSARDGRKLVSDSGLKVIRTNDDLEKFVLHLRDRSDIRAVVMAAAVCDFIPDDLGETEIVGYNQLRNIPHSLDGFGLSAPRLHTHSQDGHPRLYNMKLKPSKKIIGLLRRGEGARKDIFVVGFKTTTWMTRDQQYISGLGMLKSNSLNLVLANDLATRVNMVITPEEARYNVGSREEALEGLARMLLSRSSLRFTRSEVLGSSADLVPWDDERIPDNLREVVNWCVENGAYKPFQGKTVGHFAVKLSSEEFLTSIRRSNFNTDLKEKGLTRVIASGKDKVFSLGAKPSVGGQSQRSIFRDHPDTDCIVHFHCPPRPGAFVRVAPQWPFECGSHECGENTSLNLHDYGNGIKAVMLDNHGPNIVFSKSVPAKQVIDFIFQNFDLTAKTGGPVELPS